MDVVAVAVTGNCDGRESIVVIGILQYTYKLIIKNNKKIIMTF